MRLEAAEAAGVRLVTLFPGAEEGVTQACGETQEHEPETSELGSDSVREAYRRIRMRRS